MIAEEVIQGSERLVGWWDMQTNGFPCLHLDYNWPSIGTLDSITYFLRHQTHGGDERASFMRSVACYLGCFVHDFWEIIGKEVGEQPELLDLPDGVTLRLGSPSSPTGRVHLQVNISRSIDRLLRSDITELQVLPNFKRPVLYPQSNLLSLFGIGLALGFAPQCTGPLINRNPPDAKNSNEQILRLLARSSADYYKSVFPDEKAGQVAELYLNDLIYPPLEMNEPYLGQRAVDGILNFAEYCSLSDQSLQRLALNLALSPDEMISFAGFAVYAAILKGKPDPRVLTVASGRYPTTITLRKAMAHVREVRLGELDWLYVDRNPTEHDLARYTQEIKLSFLPKLCLPADYLRDPAIRKIVRHFAEIDFPGGVKAFNHLAGQRKDDLMIRLQRGALALLSQNKEKAQEDFEFFSKKKLDIDPLAQAYFLADYHASNAKYDEALSCLRKVQSVANERDRDESLDYTGRVATLLVYLNRHAEALTLLRKTDPEGETVPSALGQIVASHRSGVGLSSDEALLKLKALWPTNQSVLSALYMAI